MIDENLSFQQKEQIVRYLMKCYRKSSNRIHRYEICDSVRENFEIYRYDKTTCMLVDDALQELTQDERKIIRYDYMHPKEGQWYLEYFSRSTYHRLKVQAVDKFLRCLHA